MFEWRDTKHGPQIWDDERNCWVLWYGIGAIGVSEHLQQRMIDGLNLIQDTPQWQPIPREPPSEGQYFWVRKGPLAPEIILIHGHDDSAYWCSLFDDEHWIWESAREKYTHIAGPVEPPGE